MLSNYTWGQFCLFALVLVVAYYVGVGLLYYRDELRTLLTPGRRAGSLQPAGAASLVSPPELVRPTSAFGPAVAPPAQPAVQEPVAEDEREGAAQNLPTTVEQVVAGELPDSTAAATGLDASAAEAGPMEAAAALAGDGEEQRDETRTEELDHADEQLAGLIRQAAQQLPGSEAADDSALAATRQPLAVQLVEPLASFDEPIARLLDVTPVLDAPLCEADLLAAYIAQVMGGVGEAAVMPAALVGTNLEAQLLARTHEHAHELTLLFGEDD